MTRCTRSLRAFRTTAMGRLLGSCWGQFARTIHRDIVSCCTIFKANILIILTAHLFPCFLIHGFQLIDWTDIQPPTDQLSPMDIIRLVTRHTKHAGVVQGFFICYTSLNCLTHQTLNQFENTNRHIWAESLA